MTRLRLQRVSNPITMYFKINKSSQEYSAIHNILIIILHLYTYRLYRSTRICIMAFQNNMSFLYTKNKINILFNFGKNLLCIQVISWKMHESGEQYIVYSNVLLFCLHHVLINFASTKASLTYLELTLVFYFVEDLNLCMQYCTNNKLKIYQLHVM